MVNVLKAFEITARRRQEPDPKEEWWDSLTFQEQKAYKSHHPRSSKKFTTHEEKYNHHSHEAKHHEDVYKYNIEKHEKARSPEQKRKIEDKIDAAEENMLIHRARADHHKAMVDDDTPVDLIPEYGDEGEGLEDEEVSENQEGHDESSNVHDGNADRTDIDAGREGIHDTIRDSIEPPERDKKVNKALSRFKSVFSSPKQTNTIVKNVNSLIAKDKDAREALEQADKYAEKKLKPPKHILKKLGKIAAIGLAVGVSVSVAGALPTIALAAAMTSHNPDGLADAAWSAFKRGRQAKKDEPSKHELEENHVKTMIEGLQKELEDTEDEKRSETLKGLIETLKEALYKHSPEDLEETTKSRKSRRKSRRKDDEDEDEDV